MRVVAQSETDRRVSGERRNDLWVLASAREFGAKRVSQVVQRRARVEPRSFGDALKRLGHSVRRHRRAVAALAHKVEVVPSLATLQSVL